LLSHAAACSDVVVRTRRRRSPRQLWPRRYASAVEDDELLLECGRAHLAIVEKLLVHVPHHPTLSLHLRKHSETEVAG
jgi:hypothetical protein